MKDHRSEHYHWELRHWPEEEALKYFKEHCLSIDDMLDISSQRNRGYHNINYDIILKTDEESGKIYVDHDFLRCKDLLKNHLLLETLYARKDEVDWERVSCYYDYEVIDKIGDTLTSPLVWVPSEEAGEHCAVKGKVAKEVDPIEGYDNHDRYELYYQMMEKGVLWFVDHLPEYSEELHQDRYGYHFPPGILLWDRFLQAQFGHAYYGDLLKKLKFVAKERGGAKAAEIVKRLRKDWPHIIREKLFGISNLNKFEMGTVLKIEEQLNGELELYLQKWEAEAENETKMSSARGPKETTVFRDSETAEREKERFISFINRHKMSEDDVDAAWDNRVNQVAVCFYRVWKEKKMLTTKAGGTSLSRFIIDCGLSISVKEKAHGNALNRMINSTDLFTNWIGEVRASF